ncbi:MAG: hypothetical protein ABFS03_00765 [Chloroflexota bacterium]
MVDLSNEVTAMDEFDRQTEESEKIQAKIDARVDGMWQNKDEICRILMENFDVFQAINDMDYGIEEEFRKTINHYFYCDAEREILK